MSRSEGEPVSITTIHRPSLGVLKQLYVAAMGKPGRWITIFWEDPKGRFNAVNPYRETRSPRRQAILKALSPETDDEKEFLSAVINIQEVPKNEVVAKKITVPTAFPEVVAELNLDNF